MTDEGQSMAPLRLVHEPLGEDVRPHTVRLLVDETVARVLETLMEPVDANAVSSAQMSHRGVLAGATDLDHRRVIVMDYQDNVSLKQHIPQVHCWDAHSAKTVIRGHYLGLGRAVRHRRLLPGSPLQREKGVRTCDAEKDAACAPTCSLAPSEVSVGVQVDANLTRGIAHPTNATQMEGSLYIAH